MRKKMIRELAISNTLAKDIRGITAKHHSMFVRNMPNVWFGLCSTIVNYLVILKTLQAVIQLDKQTVLSFGSDERWSILYVYNLCVLIFCFLMASTYWIAGSMIELLMIPFHGSYDSYNVDALIASTGRQLFASFRASFDKDVMDRGVTRAFITTAWRDA